VKLRLRPRNVNRWVLLTYFLALSGVSLGLILAGCSDNGIVFNQTSYSEDPVSFWELPFQTDALAKRADIAEVESRYVVLPLQASLGGVIPLGDDASVEAFVVLPNSFPSDTIFTVEVSKVVTTNGEELVIYEFGPDGLQFSRPAVLRLNLAELFGKNVTAIDLFWLNEETDSWEYSETSNAVDQIACASVWHFSSLGVRAGAATDGTNAK
jgi:hypothetical protein